MTVPHDVIVVGPVYAVNVAPAGTPVVELVGAVLASATVCTAATGDAVASGAIAFPTATPPPARAIAPATATTVAMIRFCVVMMRPFWVAYDPVMVNPDAVE